MTSVAAFLPAQRNSRSGPWYLALVFLIAIGALVRYYSPLFLTSSNLSDVAAQVTPLLISALGQTFAIIVGGLDLSVGSVISMTTAVVTLHLPAWGVVPLVIGIAVTVGTINGVGVAYLNVHPLIMTLASMSLVQGVALFTRPVPGGTVPSWLVSSVSGNVFGLPAAAFWLAAAILVAWFLLYRSRFGLHLFSVGGNKVSAHLNGIPAARIIVLTYVICSLFAAVAGLFLAGRIASGDAYVGNSFGLDSITAAAVGGISLSGGIGSLIGTVVGAALVGVIGNGMNLMNISAFLQIIIKGALLLAVVSVQRRNQIGL